MEKATKEKNFKRDVSRAMERASKKVRSKAAAENKPLVFWKNNRVVKEVPKQ